MSFIGSSDLWGEESTARLCQIIVAANDGLAQQVAENRTDLLDLATKKDLEKVDDMGLSLAYLAVHHDRPEMLLYLHKRGLDLSLPCDPMGFGTPMFYAVNLGRLTCVEALDAVGYSVQHVCDAYLKMTPSYYASRLGDTSVASKIALLRDREVTAGHFFRKNILRNTARKRFLRTRRAAVVVQSMARGMLDRIMVKLVRSGHITLDSASVSSAQSGGSGSLVGGADFDDESIGSSIQSTNLEVASGGKKQGKRGKK
ncbi:hypothetical protein B484DRAFT_446809 [Ochromonadaceae sp. CCMP2298]|nr:hypothetical protein B484DRAFT_446809 [Ochromonadaceae sp. CCMP2298]|mmetsp:Transcript_10921/g.24209  ORF Transcript_10921/g.24209 Transcript_10921/m.24209 type:complete len:257 (-) Transcript_10921:274-1044(-)